MVSRNSQAAVKNLNTRRCRSFPCGLLYLWAGAALATTTTARAAGLADQLRNANFGLILAIVGGVAVGLIGIPILRKLAKVAGRIFSSELQAATPTPALATAGGREAHAEEDAFTRLAMELRAGPMPELRLLPASTTPALSRIPSKVTDNTDGRHAQLKEFFDWAGEAAGSMQRLIKKAVDAEGLSAKRDLMVETAGQIGVFKHRAGLPELRPAWQLATSVEGMIKQLTNNESNITPSTLRTIAGALELLADLSVPGVPTEMASAPPVRILAVDDDAVSCFALSAALRKTFDEPDLASNGEEGFACARAQRYDLIMLDVMMPMVNGFELCARIRETALNRSTPVLFVTALKDFASRLNSLGVGGNDLMGKPFLPFEIALKSLTLVLRGRLRDHNPTRETSDVVTVPGKPAVEWPESPPIKASDEVPAPAPAAAAEPLAPAGNSSEPTTVVPALDPAAAIAPAVAAREEPAPAAGDSPRELSKEFLTDVATGLREMKEQITAIGEMEDGGARQEMLVRLDLRLKLLADKLGLPELRSAFEVCSSVAGLLKKLEENSKNVTDSALRTATAALELVNDLCSAGVKPDLAYNPPIRIMVVDDEPLARRALSGALQLAFSRPACAESPRMALSLAAEMEFDLVFLDVGMPEIDGFAVCARIHETSLNRLTPVVFVTGNSDEDFRARSVQCGGCDFVAKPIAFVEVTVKALTYALRGRLEKLKETPAAATAMLG